MRASRRALFLMAVVSSLAVLVVTDPASAHTGFESSEPVDGSVVDIPVELVRIAFSGAAEPAGEGFIVLDPSGTVRTPDAVTSDPEKQVWTLSFAEPLADGAVGVRWTVQAPDAHPISGSFSFTVSDAGGPGGPSISAQGDEAAPGIPVPSAGVTPDSVDRKLGEMASESVDFVESQSTSEPRGVSTETQNLHKFLQRGDQPVANVSEVGAFGRLLGFVGTMLGIGGLCFGAVVVRNHRRDLRSIFKAVRYAAVVVVAGTVIDLVAHIATASDGWLDIWSAGAVGTATLSTFGLAVGLRVAAGSLLFATARIPGREIGRNESLAPRRELVLAGGPGLLVLGNPPSEADAAGRLDDAASEGQRSDHDNGTRSADTDDRPFSIASLVAVVLLLASFTLDGHTVTEGNRWVTGAVDMVHVVAASIWAGGVVAFAVVLWRRYRRRERLGGLEMALRFSVVAGVALAVAGLVGTILAVIILESVSDLWTTPWGRLLIAKTAAVAAAASLGTYNHLVVIPWMNAHPDDDARSVRIRNTVTGEAILLTVVVILTAFLVGAPSQL